jgi:carbonic anhydrase
VNAYEDIDPAYRETPVEELLAYHNLGAEFRSHPNPELLIGTCMDYRVTLRLPPDFAYLIRVGGANLRGLEFHISTAVVQGVTSICVVGHDNCAMCGVVARHREFVAGLVDNGGWSKRDAENHFKANAPHSDIGNVVGFLQWEAVRLSRRYPRVLVAPLFYSVAERVLYQVDTGELK